MTISDWTSTRRRSVSAPRRRTEPFWTQGTIVARRDTLLAWAKARPRPWIGAMEATLFTGWIYDLLKPLAQELKVAHPAMLKAITAAKKKNDKVDARTIADLLRCNLLPECYMAPSAIRDLRRGVRSPH